MSNLLRLLMAISAGLGRSRPASRLTDKSPDTVDVGLVRPRARPEQNIERIRCQTQDQAQLLIESGAIDHVIIEIMSRDLDVNVFDVSVIIAIALQIRPKIKLQFIKMTTDLKRVDGMDSLDSFQFVESIEEYFGVSLPDQIFEPKLPNFQRIKTLKDLAIALHLARNC